MSPILISIFVFVTVTALIGGIAVMMRGDNDGEVEDRLSILTGKMSATSESDAITASSIIRGAAANSGAAWEKALARVFNLNLLFLQANVKITVSKFVGITGGLAVLGAVAAIIGGLSMAVSIGIGLSLTILPVLWLNFKKKRRLHNFGAQLPKALELIARALRAGHSLAAGFQLVSTEMSEPISEEFGRVFEEQNLGMPFEEALEHMCDRIPNLDLKFFATAIVLQRQTGGDLAEILDKIGRLIRERFRILGQVQALTGEGRISGVVLLALPPVLFVVVYRLNPEYLLLLFTDEMGKQMLAGAIVMQLLGALAIRKIINIRV